MTDLYAGDCIGFAGSLFGHHFVARYSTVERQQRSSEWAITLTPLGSDAAVRPLQDRTYIGDVCTRCGAVVNQCVTRTDNG